MSEANTTMAEQQRELRDVTAHRNRLQLELNDASSRLQTAENQLSQAQRAKTALANQLDDLRQAVDESSADYTRVCINSRHSSYHLVSLPCRDFLQNLIVAQGFEYHRTDKRRCPVGQQKCQFYFEKTLSK